MSRFDPVRSYLGRRRSLDCGTEISLGTLGTFPTENCSTLTRQILRTHAPSAVDGNTAVIGLECAPITTTSLPLNLVFRNEFQGNRRRMPSKRWQQPYFGSSWFCKEDGHWKRRRQTRIPGANHFILTWKSSASQLCHAYRCDNWRYVCCIEVLPSLRGITSFTTLWLHSAVGCLKIFPDKLIWRFKSRRLKRLKHS